MKIKKIIKTVLTAVVAVAFILFGTDLWVTKAAETRLYTDLTKVPYNKVGLLLGTSKYLRGGFINPYYRYRIDAAAALFRSGKISYILVSGDNSEKHYNEPESMKKDLIAQGIPANRIFLDYAGFRTLDSILRCRDVFGTSAITIISQPFHNERALFIADHKKMTAVAFNAKDVSAYNGMKTQVREKFARVKMMLDLALGKEAKFYGEKIEIK